MDCEQCDHLVLDEETEEYYCDVDMDEDDWQRLMTRPDGSRRAACPFFAWADEYRIVRKQI